MDRENMIFVIPNTFRELEQEPEDGPENAYIVETAMTVADIEETYEIVDEGIKEAGIDLPPDFIIDNFDVFFHSLKLYTQLKQELRDEIWQTLRYLYERIIKDLQKYLDDPTRRPERQNMLNKLQMISYLFFTACELNEDRALAFANRPMDQEADKKGGRKKKEEVLVASKIYHHSKKDILKVLIKTLQLKLEVLFEPRIDVNTYVGFCLKYVYTLISNIHSFKDDATLLSSLSGIFELVIVRYDHAERFCQKVIELLQNSEDVSISLASLVTTLIRERGDGAAVLDASMLMEQLCEIAQLSKDFRRPKAVSAFLIQVGEVCSGEMLNCLDYLELLLDQDSYMIRIAIFEILFTILREDFKLVADEEADRIMNILQDYLLDTKGFCRSKVIKCWTDLAVESLISPARYNMITPIISDRLEDKKSSVRKAALHFLTIVCQTLIPCRDLKQIFVAYGDVYEKLKQQTVKNLREAAGDDRSLEDLMANLPGNVDEDQLDELLRDQRRLDRFTTIMEQIETYDNFHDIISASLPKIYDMLYSKTVADVKEAIDFFVMAYNLKLTDSEAGIQRMLLLIKNNSDVIKEKLLKAFQAIYMNEKEIDYDMEIEDDDANNENGHRRRSVGNFIGSANKAKCFREIKSLLVMIRPLNQGYLLCVEHVISQMYAKKMFTETHTDILWCLYRGYIKSSPADQRWAFVVLGMIAITNPDILLKELDQVTFSFTKMIPIPEGLKPDVEDYDDDEDQEMEAEVDVTIPDYELAMTTCQVLLRIYPFPTIESGQQFFKLDNDHAIFKAIERLLLKGLQCNRTQPEYKSVKTFFNNFAMKSIEVVYLYAKFPDRIIPGIVIPADTFIRTFTLPDAQLDDADSPLAVPDTVPISQATIVPNSQATSIVGGKVNTVSLESDHIERFLYLITGITKGYLLHMGHGILREDQIRKREKDMRKQKEMEERKRTRATERENRDPGTDVQLDSGLPVDDYSSSDDDEANAEFGGSMGNDSTVLDFIQLQIFDKEVLNNNGYLSKYFNFAMGITHDILGVRFTRPVRIAAWHAMCNFMIVSRDVTKRHVEHFKKCLEECEDEDIVSILVIYWGDILMRFPNDIEHLNPILFNFLEGPSRLLKSCALKTLSMIIVADMLKPTKEIVPMTKLIVDEDAELNNLTRLFFTQVAAKDNQNIYNWLTDVISSLAGSESKVEEDDFHEMLIFLFGLLEKAKSNESLVVKLSERFLLSTDERLNRDLSFALTLVNYDEKALRALCLTFDMNIRSAITYDEVKKNFQTIIEKLKSQFKDTPGTAKLNDLIDELGAKIEAIRTIGVDKNKLAAVEEGAEEAAAAAARAAGVAGSDDDATDYEQPVAGDASGTAGRAGSDDDDASDDELPTAGDASDDELSDGNVFRQQRRRPATTIEPMEDSMDSIESMEELEE